MHSGRYKNRGACDGAIAINVEHAPRALEARLGWLVENDHRVEQVSTYLRQTNVYMMTSPVSRGQDAHERAAYERCDSIRAVLPHT